MMAMPFGLPSPETKFHKPQAVTCDSPWPELLGRAVRSPVYTQPDGSSVNRAMRLAGVQPPLDHFWDALGRDGVGSHSHRRNKRRRTFLLRCSPRLALRGGTLGRLGTLRRRFGSLRLCDCACCWFRCLRCLGLLDLLRLQLLQGSRRLLA